MRFAVGLDISFKSPACAIHDTLTNIWYIYAFAKLVREKHFTYRNAAKNVFIYLLPKIQEIERSDVKAYLHIESHLMEVLCEHIPKEYRAEDTQVIIEGYAYATREKSGYNFKLHEIGGIMKRALEVSGFTSVEIQVCQSWKCTVIGDGHATKIDTVHFIAQNGPCVNMLTLLWYKEEDLSKDEKGDLIVPTPSQDLADACAIAMAVYTKRLSVKERKKSKKLITTEKTTDDSNNNQSSFWQMNATTRIKDNDDDDDDDEI